MRDPITYTTGEILITALVIYLAGHLGGRMAADARHRRDEKRRNDRRRRYTYRNNPNQ